MSGQGSRGDNASAGSRGQLPADGRASASPGSANLECRYRRLLAWYPADYRSIYDEEMLGVLMAAASARGSNRPGAAETLNLIGSALRTRLRSIGSGTDPAWRDALAIYSLVAPVLVTAAIYRAPWFLSFLLWGRGGAGAGIAPLAVMHIYQLHLPFRVLGWVMYVSTMATPLAPVILSLLRLRRTAILVAAIVLAWTTIQASLGWQIRASNTVAFLALLAVEVAALIASAGPRRGLRLIGWKGLLMGVPWLALPVLVDLQANVGYPGMHLNRYVVVLALIGVAGTLVSPKARRLLLLFAIPVSPFLIILIPRYEASPDLIYVAPAFPSLVAFLISRRSRHKQQPDHTIGNVA
jgi:hypothetical protein